MQWRETVNTPQPVGVACAAHRAGLCRIQSGEGEGRLPSARADKDTGLLSGDRCDKRSPMVVLSDVREDPE